MTIPELKFEPPEDWPPASGIFDTRDYYPLRDEESQAEWDRRVSEIVSRTEKRSPKYKLGYDSENTHLLLFELFM